MHDDLLSLSVIIPTYNYGRFIGFALESLFRQSYPSEKIEIIVIDDGSTDNTPEILERYAERVVYVRQENKGIAAARNKGISLAKGEIITFLDADDVWHEERSQEVINKFREKPDTGMVYHPIELIDSQGNTICKDFYKAFGYREGLSGWITNDIFSGRIFCGGSSFSFKKDIMDKVYPIPEDIRRGIDYYMVAISSCYASAEFIPDILGKYRFHGNNISFLAGKDDYKKLAIANKDLAFMRQKIIEEISSLNIANIKTVDLSIIKRTMAKEIIFYSVLDGKRFEGIKSIPLLFKGRLTFNEILKCILIILMTLFVPAPAYPKLIKAYDFLKRGGRYEYE